MMNLLKLLLYCLYLTTLNVRALKADGSFEDADQVNEYITMSFSSSHPYDLRQTIPGEPEIDYPIYSAVPRTNFDCNGRHEGYYADTEARCQVFRICANTDLVGRGFAFLCPNGTLFSQKNFVCDWYRNVDCNDSERYYSKNDNNRLGTKNDIMKTVRQMMEHPMKTISIALNRGKSSTLKPSIENNLAPSTTKISQKFPTSSSPASRLQAQDNLIIKQQPLNLNQGVPASRFTSPLKEVKEESPKPGQTKILTPPLEGEFKPLNVATFTITPPSPLFTPPFETPSIIASYKNLLASDNASLETYPFATDAGTPLSPTEANASEKEVFISSLGELSTDPGADFNRQTSHIISDSPSNALDTEIRPLNASGMNFAEKVNAGLNGQKVLNYDEVIAPEYVKNIMQQNGGLPDDFIQPVPFDLASNINSLLDEVNYEAQLRSQNSAQFQHRTFQKESRVPTKKPFRFLSRGFSRETSKVDGGSYVYGFTSAPKSTSRSTQHSASTQSYSNSLITTLLTTTQPPVTSTDTTQIIKLGNGSENPQHESNAVKLNTKSEADDKGEPSISESFPQDKTIESQDINKPESELEAKLDSKAAVKREQKELKQLDSVGSELKDLPEEVNDENKANANKRAEYLLLAGVKQITVNDPDEKSKTSGDEVDLHIVPIYSRVTAPQTSTPHITSSSTTSTISTTAVSTTMPSTVYSSTTDGLSTSTLTTTVTPTPYSTAFETSTIPAVSIRRFTAEKSNRRQISRPISYSRRNNLQRSNLRTTSTTKATTTAAPIYRGRAGGLRSTSTTTASATTKITTSPRKRLNANRYTYGSRRRTTDSSSSTSLTTTVVPRSKKVNVRSSDSALSDLTAVASTYNAVQNQSYNSVRQSSLKYTETKRRRPSNKNITSETTKPSLRNTTTQQPRSSSSYPTPTLAPFSHHEALSPIYFSSTTPEPSPATFLSFNDLTKSITDDSILQNFRKNPSFNRQLIDSTAFRSQQQALPRQQIPLSTTPRIQQERSTQRPPLPTAYSLPFIPLKDFIASKFGPEYSPEPPKLSTTRPSLKTSIVNDDFVLKPQKKTVSDQQYSKQQYGGARQGFAPQTDEAVKLPTPVHTSINQNVFQQQSQLNIQQQQQQQQQQYQEQQLRLQQQQLKLQQLKQQQNHLQQQYQLQQQKLQQQQQLQQRQQQHQKLQQPLIPQQQKPQVPQQQYFSTNQQQIFPIQQHSQFQQTAPTVHHQQQQRIPIQQQGNSVHQVSTKIVPSVEQQFQIQRSQQIQQPISLPQQQQPQSQIQIFPSQMAVAQTIPPQQPSIQNINLIPHRSEIGSINISLPSNLAGLIPNTNTFDSSRNINSMDNAQKRSDQAFEDAYGGRERKSVFAGVSSYDVPLSSVGRLANDITHLLRQRRL